MMSTDKPAKVIQGWPPCINEIRRHWGPVPSNFVFTQYPYIYCPISDTLPPDIQIHEEVHLKQQKDNVDMFIQRFLIDPQFRYDMELEAYAKQYLWIKDNLGNSAADAAITELANNLSTMYNLELPLEKCEVAIRRLAKKLK